MPSESPLFTSDQEHLRLQKALRESEILRELSALLASSLDLTSVMQVLTRRTTEVCEVERCAIWLVEESRRVLVPKTYHLSAQHLDREHIQRGDIAWQNSSLPLNNLVIDDLFHRGGLVFYPNLSEEPDIQIVADTFLVRSILLVALMREGRAVGMMTLDNPGKLCSFSQDQQQLACAIGQQATLAIDNARLYEQAQKERRRAETMIRRSRSIYQVAMAVNSGEDLPTVLNIAIQQLAECLDASHGAIALLDRDTLSIVNTTDPQGAYSNVPLVLTDLPHCCNALEDETPYFISIEQLSEMQADWCRQLGVTHAMIVPLIVGTPSLHTNKSGARLDTTAHKRCAGFAFVGYANPSFPPGPGQFAFAQDIAAQCALAIEKARILSEAQQAARLATERANTLDAVLEAMNEGILVLDMDGQLLVSNKIASQFLGVPIHATQQLRAFYEQYPTFTLTGHPISYDDFPLTRALRGEQMRGERFVTHRADHSERTIEMQSAPLFDGEGRQKSIVNAFRDVTEQVRVERRIRRALDTMLHAAEAISGLTDIQEIMKHILTMTLNALNSERGGVFLYDQEQAMFTPLLCTGLSEIEQSAWIEKQQRWLSCAADQDTKFVTSLLNGHATLVPLKRFKDYPQHTHFSGPNMLLAAPIAYNNHLLGVMILDRAVVAEIDTTGPKTTLPRSFKREFNTWDSAVVEGIAQFAGLAVEQALWQQKAETARLNEAAIRASSALKDEFLAITVHEFRSPLTVILAHSQMMSRALRRKTGEELREKITESMAIIEHQAHQLTKIVETFLEVTRFNHRQITLDLKPLDLVEIVKAAIAQQRATTKNHQLSYKVERCDQPYLVRADSARLSQVLANLLQNAIKYSPQGGPIVVSLQQGKIDEGQKMVEVCVKDKGIGVPLDAQSRLFELFYRAPNINGSKAKGVGLGLYIVSEILHLHGGSIRVESSGEYNAGSSFIFTLPLLESESESDTITFEQHA